jgi:hypothetical protein
VGNAPSSIFHPLLGRVSQREASKNFHLVGKYERSRSVLETDEVHVAVEIVYFLDYLDGLGKADMAFVIPYRFEQPAIFPFWVIGGGIGSRGFHRLLLTSSGF